MNKIARLIAKTAAAAAVAASVALPAKAELVGFYYGTDLVATVETSGFTTFDVKFLYAPANSGIAFINDLLLGYGGTGTGTFSNLPSTGDTAPTATGCLIGTFQCNSDQPSFDGDWKISWPTAGNADRFQEGERSLFSITVTNNALWDFGRLHINAFLANGESIKLTGTECLNGVCSPPRAEVPEPGSLALVSLALLGLGAARRRRAQ